MFKVLKSVPWGFHSKLVLETVDQKPDLKTVLWFSKTDNDGLIPHLDNKSRVARAHRGAVNTKFRETQYELFKQYFGLTDQDQVPYKLPYAKAV